MKGEIKKLKIASVSAEVAPFSKTGGLADVARSLPKALKELGHEVIVITPLYGMISKRKFNLKKIIRHMLVRLDKTTKIYCDVWQGELIRGLPVYFIDNEDFFGKYKTIYKNKNPNARFLVFNKAALRFLTKIEFKADVVQCHDWHTGLIPYYLKTFYKKSPTLRNTASLFTIHNISFQFGKDWWKIPHHLRDYGWNRLPFFPEQTKIERLNFARRGIIYADLINTVSEQYAKEILTPEGGAELHRLLKRRKERLFGIINGIDYEDYNPASDPGLKVNYDINTLEKKIINKLHLQKKFHLPQNSKIPLIGIASRITEQKGFDLLINILDYLVKLDLQLVIYGGGEKTYEQIFARYSRKFSQKIAAHLKFETKYVTQVYAGSDMFLMPSRFEPCGLGQLISLRYGSVPIVRATGGLLDTITDFNPQTKKGNGFSFTHYDPISLLITVIRALETYKYSDVWKDLVKRGMRQSFSWEIPAKKYIVLFKKAIKFKKQK